MTSLTLINGDSSDMSQLGPSSVHLVVTSPPYPMIEMWDPLFASLDATSFDSMHEYLKKTWQECYRTLVPGGICCINIGDAARRIEDEFMLYTNHVRITEICQSLGFHSLPYILWKKPTNKPNAFLGSGFLPPNAYVTIDCEFILIFRKGNLRRFPTKDAIRKESIYTKYERDIWFSQIWDDIKGAKQCGNNEMERRTAAFPYEVPYRLIRMFSCVTDTVLDPFCGTGTTLKAASDLGRNAIGYELDTDLIEVVKEKLRSNDHGATEGREFHILYQGDQKESPHHI